MTIAEKERGDKGLISGFMAYSERLPVRRLLWGGSMLLGLSGSFGLGIVYERMENEAPKDPGFWIEQIPQASAAEVMPEPLPGTLAPKPSKKTRMKPAPAAAVTPIRPASTTEPARAATPATTTPVPAATVPVAPITAGGEVIAAKGGTAYYLPWCTGVKRISAANRIVFPTKEAAEAKGYKPSKNCKGI